MPGQTAPYANAVAELALGTTGYGGGLQLQPNGDLLKVIDTPGNPAATQQRLARIILTNPLIKDAYGRPISRPDDLFNPTFGSGVRALVGEPVTPALTTQIQNQILMAIAQDPGIATNPAPVVTVLTDGNNDGYVLVSVTCYTVTGQIVTTPSLSLQVNGG